MLVRLGALVGPRGGGCWERHGDQLGMPRPAEVGCDDGQVGKAGGDDVQMDRSRRIELDPLASWLPGADATGAGVEKTGDLELGGFFPELEMSFIARIEVLHRGMELGSPCAQLGNGSFQFLGRGRVPGIDRSEEGVTFRMAPDEAGHEVVGNLWTGGGRLRIP